MNKINRINTLECKLSILIVVISSSALPGEIIQNGTCISNIQSCNDFLNRYGSLFFDIIIATEYVDLQ